MENSIQCSPLNTNLQNISVIKQCINKLQYILDYDRCEIDRLRADLEHILDVDVDEYKCSFFSSLSLKTATKNSKKLTAVNLELLNACNNATYDECIEILNIYINRIIKLQQSIADNRYDIRAFVLNPSSGYVKGLIVTLFNMLETDWNCVRVNIENLEIYLENNFQQTQLCNC
jgi:hypothetical protein